MDHRDPEYKNPVPTVDIIVEYGDYEIVLIERKNDPKGLALPGGFIDEGESAAEAAIREAREELGVGVKLKEQFFTYSDPARDPRQHVISTVFIARVEPPDEEYGLPSCCDNDPPFKAGDDAKEVHVVYVGDLARRALLNDVIIPTEKLESLVFDHAEILVDYFTYRIFGKRPGPK